MSENWGFEGAFKGTSIFLSIFLVAQARIMYIYIGTWKHD
jgi:hypothetical protein